MCFSPVVSMTISWGKLGAVCWWEYLAMFFDDAVAYRSRNRNTDEE